MNWLLELLKISNLTGLMERTVKLIDLTEEAMSTMQPSLMKLYNGFKEIANHPQAMDEMTLTQIEYINSPNISPELTEAMKEFTKLVYKDLINSDKDTVQTRNLVVSFARELIDIVGEIDPEKVPQIEIKTKKVTPKATKSNTVDEDKEK
jgi:hypothetical protein